LCNKTDERKKDEFFHQAQAPRSATQPTITE